MFSDWVARVVQSRPTCPAGLRHIRRAYVSTLPDTGSIIGNEMGIRRLTFGKVALAWAVLLWSAALVLPNLDSRTRAHPAAQIAVAVFYLLLIIGTPVAFFNYFNKAWRRVDDVPNRGVYTLWLTLESVGALALLALLAYPAVRLFAARLR